MRKLVRGGIVLEELHVSPIAEDADEGGPSSLRRGFQSHALY